MRCIWTFCPCFFTCKIIVHLMESSRKGIFRSEVTLKTHLLTYSLSVTESVRGVNLFLLFCTISKQCYLFVCCHKFCIIVINFVWLSALFFFFLSISSYKESIYLEQITYKKIPKYNKLKNVHLYSLYSLHFDFSLVFFLGFFYIFFYFSLQSLG